MKASSLPTIAAIATASGGGVGIVRVSGPLAAQIGQACCRPWPEPLQSHHLYYGVVTDEQGAGLDRVLFCLMRAPRSYTGDDVLEIHGHGGARNLQQLLERVLRAGAIPAGPGDFTRRAFLMGKLDLLQAEALLAGIGATSVQMLRHAHRQMEGELGGEVGVLRRRLELLRGRLEANLDFPDLLVEDTEVLCTELAGLQEQVSLLAESYDQAGKGMSRGFRVVLIGQANAGKSSLLNALSGSERVLVHQEPGTTRDYVEVRTAWADMAVALVDTAGYRPDSSSLEEEGRRLSLRQSEHADLALLVVDGTQGLGEPSALTLLPPGIPFAVVWNKTDAHQCRRPPAELNALPVSALCGWGLAEVRRLIQARLQPGAQEGSVILNVRQARLLRETATRLRASQQALQEAVGWDAAAADLREAQLCLAEMVGSEVREDVLTSVFSQFCIGK